AGGRRTGQRRRRLVDVDAADRRGLAVARLVVRGAGHRLAGTLAEGLVARAVRDAGEGVGAGEVDRDVAAVPAVAIRRPVGLAADGRLGLVQVHRGAVGDRVAGV